MKKIYLLACVLIFSVTVNAGIKTWVGGASGEWWGVFNWSPTGLPSPTDDVVINGGTVYVYGNAFAKSVTLHNDAQLIVWSDISLSIPQESPGIAAINLNSGTTLKVLGILNIGSATADIPTGIAASDANIFIEYGGKISVEWCQNAVNLDGSSTLTNDGNLEIGQSSIIADRGIFIDNATLQNMGFGIIKIDNVQGPAIGTPTSPSPPGLRTINNNGMISIGEISDLTGGISATDAAVNNSGNMYIDRAVNGMELTRGTLITNPDSRMVIGNNRAVAGSGIVTSGTVITNGGVMSIKTTQGDGLQLTGGSFTNNHILHIGHDPLGSGNVGSGNIGGIGIHTNGTVINNNADIDFGIVNGHGMQLENGSLLTNSGDITGDTPFGYTGTTTVISGSIMTLDHSTFINAASGKFRASTTNANHTVSGITMNNFSEVENRGRLEIAQPKLGLSIDGHSEFINYGVLADYYGLIRGLYLAGGSLFENKTGGAVNIGATLTTGTSLVYITGSGSTLLNRDSLLVNYGNSHGIEIVQQGRLLNPTGVITIHNIQQKGIEVKDNGMLDSDGTINLNSNINPVHAGTGGKIYNGGMLNIGNVDGISGTGIAIEGAGTRFENNATGKITVNRIAPTHSGIRVTTGAVFENDGKITWGTPSLPLEASEALQVVNSGVFDNRIIASPVLEFVNCASDAIVSDVNSPSTGSKLFLSGVIRFGNITGRGLYNSDPNYTISNAGHFETMPGGKMNLQARVDNTGPTSVLLNVNGTVTLAYPFSNKGDVVNDVNGTITNLSAFGNDGGIVTNHGTWNTTGTFTNYLDGVCRGRGTFQGSVFMNTGGALMPGSSPGCLNMANGFLNQSPGTLDIEVNGKNNPCGQFDRVNVTGTATLTGALNVTFGGGYAGTIGDKITILKSSSLAGTFSSHNLPNGWTILYNTPATGDVTLSRIVALPLHLLKFSAKKDGDKAHISWTTTDEVNTSHFELERSDNGSQFQKIATIASINAAGEHPYELIDQQPLAGINHYRLKMIDIDGTYTYSWVASVDMDKPQAIISSIYPNPATDIVNVVVAESSNDLSIQLISLDGKTLQTKRLAVRGTYPLNIARLPAGIYFIKVNNGETHKLIKQ